MQALLKRHPITSYFLLSFLLAWAVWIPVGLFVPNVVTAHILPGAWAPTIAALVLTAVLDGRAGVRRLLRGVLKWRVAWYWYVFAILGPTLVVFAAILVHLLLGGTAPTLAGIAARFGLPAERAMLVLGFLPLVYVTTIFAGGPIAEELGWRGYAQPRLQAHIGPTFAGLAIGVLWGFWHLPLFFFLPSATGDVPLTWFLPLTTACSVLFGWLYNQTGGSVLLCMLFHAGINFVLGAVGLVSGSLQLLTLFTILMGVAALVVGMRTRQAGRAEWPAVHPSGSAEAR